MKEDLESKSKDIVIINPDETSIEARKDVCPYIKECDLSKRSKTIYETLCVAFYKNCKVYAEMIARFD